MTLPDEVRKAWNDVEKALTCLYIAVDSSVADDVKGKVTVYNLAIDAHLRTVEGQLCAMRTALIKRLHPPRIPYIEGAERTECSCRGCVEISAALSSSAPCPHLERLRDEEAVGKDVNLQQLVRYIRAGYWNEEECVRRIFRALLRYVEGE